MVMFADGGLLASKPYAASGAYIDRMSDYCAGCVYDPAIKTGEGGLPVQSAVLELLSENRAALERYPRMAMPYRTLDAWPRRGDAILREARLFLEQMDREEQPAGRAQTRPVRLRRPGAASAERHELWETERAWTCHA